MIVLMPPLSITKDELRRLVAVTAESIRAAKPLRAVDPAARNRADAALLDAA